MYNLTVAGSGFSRFDDLAKKLKSFDAPLAEIGAYLEFKAKNRFRLEQAPDGTKWAPLAPSTLANKKRLGKSTRILSSDGGLAASIAFRVVGNAVVVKPSMDYAIFHQLGTTPYTIRPKKKATLSFYTADGWRSSKSINHPGLKPRPFMGFEPGDAAKISQILVGYLDG
jgi:phage virion morphogenesis protein